VAWAFGFPKDRRGLHTTFFWVLLGYWVSSPANETPVVPPLLLPLVFVAFNLFLYAGIYVLNDIIDLPLDRLHPTKQSRPIASGEVSVPLARLISLVLIGAGLATSYALSWYFALFGVCFLVVNVLYSVWLKHVRYADLAANTITYPLRILLGIVLAGGVATAHLPIIFSATGFMWTSNALRRLHELRDSGARARPVLTRYGARQLFWLALLPTVAWPVLLFLPASPVEKGVVALCAALWSVMTVGTLWGPPRMRSAIRWMGGWGGGRPSEQPSAAELRQSAPGK
jgi:4-hydroxybenzoate polyprenyltransferase